MTIKDIENFSKTSIFASYEIKKACSIIKQKKIMESLIDLAMRTNTELMDLVSLWEKVNLKYEK